MLNLQIEKKSMLLKQFIVLFMLLYSVLSTAQNMEKGYAYLENGNYSQAIIFFESILKTHPENKTARLCFGRAVGLNGNAEKAITLFTKLVKDFPNDYEVHLNYAEALLWNKNYTKAQKTYLDLLKKNDKSFPALLGYANTLSNLKEYKDALTYVNQALIIHPNNQNALISKKYIRLGIANEYTKTQKYTEAENILNKNFADFPNDKETLLNLANLYLISNQTKKAETVYKKLGEKEEHQLIALNGLSLVSHLNAKDKKALEISKSALQKIETTENKDIQKQTKERYIQALIWNKKYNLATKEITTLLENNGEQNWVLALRASLNTYKSDFKKSLADYNTILKNDSTSFDGNLGKANALKALGHYNEGYKSATKTLTFYNNQKDALTFIKELNKKFTPYINTKFLHAFDNGDNETNAFLGNISFPLSTKLKLLGNYTFRHTQNTINTTQANTNSISGGLAYQLTNNITIKSTLGLTNANAVTNDYNQLLADIFIKTKPFKLQNIEFGYNRSLQDFNADLVNREIIQNNFVINYNVNTNFNLGWFSQYYYTNQSDDNSRNLFFTSLYYTFLDKPIVKTGINYQNISFKNQVPTIYFSPAKFNAYEVFINILKSENISKEKEWFYELTGATGFQFIESNDKESTYRIQAKLGYIFSERALLNLYGTQTNISSSTASGFNYTEAGISFKWYFIDLPVFKIF